MQILPSMPVPPFDGVRDGLVYHLSNLSLEGFKGMSLLCESTPPWGCMCLDFSLSHFCFPPYYFIARKENISVEIAGIRAGISGGNDAKKSLSANGRSIEPSTESFSKNNHGTASTHQRDCTSTKGTDTVTKTKSTEILCIDVHSISAVLEKAIWSFEQTYMPYLKGTGMASAQLWGGSIRLVFELRKKRTACSKKWEPVLCLHDKSCSIDEVDLQLQGEGKLTWIVNKLGKMFKSPLRDYVVRIIVGALTNRSGWLLERLNR